MKELKEIFDRLGMNGQNGLFLTDENRWRGRLPARVEWLIEKKLGPKAFFCIDNKPIVLFYDSPQNREELFKAIWNFNESPVVIINEPNTVEIFNGLSYLKDEKTLAQLEEDESKLNAFSYFELVTGKTWQEYGDKLKYQNRVDYKLLENIRAARDRLISDYKINSSLANALIGKCIFIRYLIDRKVRINFDGALRAWTNDEFCKLLKNKDRTIEFLNYLKDRFNGEAFLLEDSHLEKIPEGVFDTLSQLMRGTEIATRQLNLFDIYDFSIIPVEFISNVYEHFIGEENQATGGAYYTPLFLVDYIIAETVEKYFDEHREEYNCKVLDPACGSGIFLVEALRRMIESYREIKGITSTKTEDFKKVLKDIAEENIYGIDLDENAINVALFSIYLALLDYQEPKEIENFKFPELRNKNLFRGDFFDLKADFNNIIKKISFNFILGNPPWKRGSDKNASFLKYIEERKKRESERVNGGPQITVSNKEIVQAFLLRTSDFSSAQTKCAMIATSKTLYNLNAKDFRSYFLHNYFIDKVFELAPVATEVFSSANAPAAILFFKYSHGEKTDSNILTHLCLKPNRLFSLFKIFVLQKNDIKEVVQKRLKEYDWLWKVLVYGSYLDFNLINRIENEYTTPINEFLKKNKQLSGQGIIVGDKDKKYDTKHLIGKPLIDHKKDIEQFRVNASSTWSEEKVTREREKDLFIAPFLLVKHSLKNFKAIAAISYSNALYKHSLTGIKGNNTTLRMLCGLLNSDLFRYYTINNSIVGIDRGRAHDKEKFSFPFVDNPKIVEIVEQVEKLCQQLYREKQAILNSNVDKLEQEKQILINQLNEEVFKSFDLNIQEKALVDYAVNVTIPLLMRHNEYDQELLAPIDYKDELLKEYAELFVSRFKNSFMRSGNYFEAEIRWTKYIIGIFFKVIPQPSESKDSIIWSQKKEDNLLAKIASLGFAGITEQLFVQKDIRGFEKDGFYIIKPNEKKLWHKAIAYLDLDEFVDAILKAGKEAYLA